MSRRDYDAAVKAAKKLDANLRAGNGTPLVSPYTPDRKTGNGNTTFKTLTAAVRVAESARADAQEACDKAMQYRDDAQGAARAALEHVQTAAKQSGKDKLAISAMLEEHALETRGVVGRGVMLCAGIALLELVPLLLLLYFSLAR